VTAVETVRASAAIPRAPGMGREAGRGRLCRDGGHRGKDQQDPVPPRGVKDDGQDEADQVELDDGAERAHQEVAADAESLTDRDHDDDADQQQRQRELRDRQVEDGARRAHGRPVAGEAGSPARNAWSLASVTAPSARSYATTSPRTR
jgi:hypothetical protein